MSKHMKLKLSWSLLYSLAAIPTQIEPKNHNRHLSQSPDTLKTNEFGDYVKQSRNQNDWKCEYFK